MIFGQSTCCRFEGLTTLPRMEEQPGLFSGVIATPKRPLLKWAGGKAQLLGTLRRAMPTEFSRYAEIFFGGGALFWSLGLPGSFVADSNPELINFYLVVRDAPSDLLPAVGELPITKADYYRIRALDPRDLPAAARAARFVYLNKTCFNGLYPRTHMLLAHAKISTRAI